MINFLTNLLKFLLYIIFINKFKYKILLKTKFTVTLNTNSFKWLK